MKIKNLAKKFQAITISAVMVIIAIPFSAVQVKALTFGDFQYSVLGDSVTISGYIGKDTEVFIPQIIDEKLVTTIGFGAFMDCAFITKIDIPNSVVMIRDYAFANCTSLLSLEAENVEYIGDCLTGCTSLKLIYLPDTLTDFNCDLGDCISLNRILSANPDNYELNSWGGLVKDKTELIAVPIGYNKDKTSFEIPDTITQIGKTAFRNTQFTTITIPNSVTSIGSGAFEGCTSLTSINIPNTVVDIGNSAFAFCTSLTSVELPNGISIIDGWTFNECTALENVTIPNSVESIMYSAFYGCTSLKSVTIPNTVTEIGWGAFGYGYDWENDEIIKIDDFKICGYNGSEAEKYANENGFKFVPLGGKSTVEINLTNLITLKEYLQGKTDLDNNLNYDLNGDEKVNVFDIAIFKRNLIYDSQQ